MPMDIIVASTKLSALNGNIVFDIACCNALIKKVITFYKANGKEKTFAAINAQSPDFKSRMVGKDMGELNDADGFSFAKKITEIAISKEGKGWVDYKWPNPVTKAIEAKSTYIERADDVYFAVGVYK
jgi:cytochrome c